MAAGKHIIVAKVDNRPGVVSRISGFFTRRGYNIESLVTGMTLNRDVYHLTVSMLGTEEEVGLLIRQLARITDVIEVKEAGYSSSVTHELMYIKLRCDGDSKASAIKIADAMDMRIAGVGENTVVIEVVGDEIRLESAVCALSHFGIEEIIRSGAMSLDI